MASNEEIISNAVEQVLSSGEPVDLLLISRTLDEINGESVGTDVDYGMHYNYLYIGMSGQRLVDQMNSNWRATDAQFLAHNDALNIRILSNEIKEMKIENGIVYYATEPAPITEEDDREWTPLQAQWGKITGNLENQLDLKQALDGKVSQQDFDTLSIQVGLNSSDIVTLQGNVSTISDSLTSLINTVTGTGGILTRLSAAEISLSKKITSQQVLEIRTVNGTALEFTIDGTHWLPVSSAGVVEWGDVLGDINNQADLQLLFQNINTTIDSLSNDIEALESTVSSLSTQIQNIQTDLSIVESDVGELQGNVQTLQQSLATIQDNITSLTTLVGTLQAAVESAEETVSTMQTNLSNHIDNTNNPHNVTKSQVGLGNVDNTSDIDKPVSTAQQAAINAALGDIKFKSMSQSDYEALTTKDNSTLYFINDLD